MIWGLSGVIYEICVDSVAGVRAARDAGAQRVELCANLLEGGTTPSLGLIRAARKIAGIGLHVIIRPRGGDFLFLNSLEYQIPILANDQLFFVAFVDSGTVEPSVEIKDYRVAAGVGARIVVPMLGPVPIALDFGFPIVKGPGDREQLFSFWVGFFH